MNNLLSENTKAILLLTAPLRVGKGESTARLLTPSEYTRLARHLHELQQQPADLAAPDAGDLIEACESVVPAERLHELLRRGFLLSQAVERWRSRAIWVVSRADADYPHRLKSQLRSSAPALLYGCGPIELLDEGGLAVVGSRHVDETLIESTMSIGHLSARARKTVISGGAKGIDQAAMHGALRTGGKAVGVLADGLEKASLARDCRAYLQDEKLVLISPYDPNAGFNVGHAMQRNKLIYALADRALVMSCDLEKGGTWAGATEQLNRLHSLPVYVRAPENGSDGLKALLRKGGQPWPDPQSADSFKQLFLDKTEDVIADVPAMLFPHAATEPKMNETPAEQDSDSTVSMASTRTGSGEKLAPSDAANGAGVLLADAAHADVLFSTVRQVFEELLQEPLKEKDIASRLQISTAQAKLWLKRLLDEGLVARRRKPAGFVARQSRLFR